MGTFLKRLILGLTAAFLCMGAAPIGLPNVGAGEITAFLKVEPKRSADKKTEFEKRLVAELTTKPDVGAASQKLVAEFSLSEKHTRRLIELWIIFVLYDQNTYFGYDPNVSREESDRREAVFKRELRDALIEFVRDTGHERVTVIAVSKALSSYSYECSREDFSAIIKDATADVAWLAAEEANCSGFWQGANTLQPMNAAILLRMAEYGLMPRAQRIAVLEHIRRLVAATAPADAGHAMLDGYLARNLAYDFWDADLLQDGVQLYESLPPAEQQFVREGKQPPLDVALGGHVLRIPMTADQFPLHEAHEFHEQLAAARLLQGRENEARAVLQTSGTFGASARAAFECHHAGPSRKKCGELDARSLRFAYLDQYLNRPDADPYDLFEFSQGWGGGWGESGLWVETLLRTTHDASYRPLAESHAKYWDPFNNVSSYDQQERVEFEATLDPELRKRIVDLQGLFADRVRANGGTIETADYRRESIPAPKSAHFVEGKLPPCPASPKVAAVKLDAKTFPSGYAPVRAERSGDLAVVVSLSQNYDPAGEVSGGGFWVHLSNDGGKTWAAPYYTGLAQFFPYDVRAASCVPLIAGDRLQVEVEVKELDTASITYPPVGMRWRREQTGLYLEILLAELRKDRDSDGLSDIAEESLLLDPANGDSDGDGVPDAKDPFPNVRYTGKHTANEEAMAAVLAQLSKQEFGALIEPVERGPGELIGGWGAPTVSLDRPFFIGGNKADFGGFTAKQMTLVYSDEELAKIRRMKADFHAMTFSSLTLNRSGTRGFIAWSAGWVGGMFRVVKEEKGWRVEVLSDWIT